eukprot:SAG11_NODE_13431_length_655_cov_1.255396_1_plen_21_part_01
MNSTVVEVLLNVENKFHPVPT